MEKIPFKVSARTARLIGRENVSTPESALIELIKNTYDADAKTCILIFDIKFPDIPEEISFKNFRDLLTEKNSKILNKTYTQIENMYYKKKMDSTDINNLLFFFRGLNSIYIIDNGDGMDRKTIEDHWMTIGTDIKQKQIMSEGERIITGAKGIGRFALDRLGDKCVMFTTYKKTNESHKWEVDWSDFEKDGATISDVGATLDRQENFSYFKFLNDLLLNFDREKLIDPSDFNYGTCFKISNLRDNWAPSNILTLYNVLKVLNPPVRKDFKLFLLSSSNPDLSGKITSADIEDFDYKLHAEVDSDQNVTINIFRNEFDIDSINKEFFENETMQKEPYTLKDFKKGSHQINTTLKGLLTGYEDPHKLLENIGAFDFTLYFMKRSSSPEDQNKYHYRSFKPTIRRAWLNRYGGIKLYRDFFRIRPYGEVDSSFFDWLNLGIRVAGSPAAPSNTSGQWKVRANQVAGIINISRIGNIKFDDKSSREGLQISPEFELFRNIVIALISRFESDRQTIMRNLEQYFKETDKEEEKKEQAKSIAKKIVQYMAESAYEDNEKKTMAEAISVFVREVEDKNMELKLLRTLASNGIVISTFSHELENINSYLVPRTERLKVLVKNLIPKEKLSSLKQTQNPISTIDDMISDDKKLSNWLDFALSSIRLDKRKRKKINLLSYFNELKNNWESVLEGKRIEISLPNFSADNKFWIKGFIMDFDAIFYNLIANSIEAFKRKGAPDERKITVELFQERDIMKIIYRDSGPGLLEEIKDPYWIFEPFNTTKRDGLGREIGTGLGMWIIKSTIEEYKGRIKLGEVRIGFEVILELPLFEDEGYEDEI
jgi:signal transduction histidine kinase